MDPDRFPQGDASGVLCRGPPGNTPLSRLERLSIRVGVWRGLLSSFEASTANCTVANAK